MPNFSASCYWAAQRVRRSYRRKIHSMGERNRTPGKWSHRSPAVALPKMELSQQVYWEQLPLVRLQL
jgi:hypothetical protein